MNKNQHIDFVGLSFEDLDRKEMDSITGAGDLNTESTPATPVVPYLVGAGAGFVTSYVASAWAKCR